MLCWLCRIEKDKSKRCSVITQREQRNAAKEFAKRWEGVGYEKGDSARFWMSLLNEVYGVERPAEYIRFEDQVMLDNTSFIDGFIPSTHVLIEQKSIDKNLRKAIRQSGGSLLTLFNKLKDTLWNYHMMKDQDG